MRNDWILVVDDSKDFRESLTTIMEFDNIKARTAENGLEALDILDQCANNPPKVIFLEMWMPVMNGIKFMTQRTMRPDLLVIPTYVVTADATATQLALNLGAQGCLIKPACLTAMLNVCKKHMTHT